MDNESLVIYVIVVLCLGAVLIMSKDNAPRLKRGMALTAVIMIALAFVFIIYSLLT